MNIATPIQWSTNIQNDRCIPFAEQTRHQSLAEIPGPTCQKDFHRAPAQGAASLRPAQTPSFLYVGGRDRPGKCDGQFLGRLQRELDRDPRGRPKLGVHEIDGDGLLQQGVVRMVVGHHRVSQIEPPVTALAGTARRGDLNDRGAHPRAYAARCFCRNANTFFQPSSACSIRYIGRS